MSDFWAYMLPMAAFLIVIQISSWWKEGYAVAYVARTVLAGGLLIWLWPKYTKIRWNAWWLGVVVGVVGVLQWVPMQLWLGAHFSWFAPAKDAFDPFAHFDGRPGMLWAFIAVRFIGAVLVVPVMEELFWRDFLWRSILAPNDFKLAGVGEWDWKAFVIVALAFATVHGNWALTAIVWAMMVGALLVWTRSLGACIIAHAVTNLLLGIYVLYTRQWFFW